MEKSDIEGLVTACPLRITMTSGEVFEVEKPEFITVADYTVSILCDRDGAKRHVLLALMNIANAESLAQPTI